MMRSLILLRLLADKLSNEELESAIFRFMQVYGPNFILKAIFNEFTKSLTELNNDMNEIQQYLCNCGELLSSSKHKGDHRECKECKRQIPQNKTFWHCNKQNNYIHSNRFYICDSCIQMYNKKMFPTNKINKFNKIISDVIHSRKSDTCMDMRTVSSTKIDELPPELISQLASFLPMSSYFALERSNRRLHIGCNTPFSLHLFDSLKCDYTLPINWYRFKSIKSLHITANNIEDFNELFESNTCIVFNDIKELTIDYKYLCLSDQLNEFVETKCINFNTIEKLSLLNIGNHDYKFNVNDMIAFLSLFSNVKYLDLHHIFVSDFDGSDNENEPENSQLLNLPYLIHIKRDCITDILWTILVNACGERVISLDCFDCSIVRNTFYLFKSLRKLHIRDVNTVEFIYKNKNLQSLEEIHIDEMESMQTENIENEIINLIKCQKKKKTKT
eukprot:76624_1